METSHRLDSALAFRWIARIWSVASIALILAFIVGERSLPSNAREWIGFVFFPFGISAGMILAWRNELAGGALTVASLVVFYLVQRAMAGVFPQGWAWLVFAAPGFLFLATWLLARRSSGVAA